MQKSDSPVNSVKQAITQGQFAQAIELANVAISGNSLAEQEHRDILYLQCVAHRQHQQPERAIAVAQTLLARNPDHARVYQEMGYAQQALGQKQLAASAFYQATLRNPSLVGSWRALSTLYPALGNPSAAEYAQQQVAYLSALPREILGARDLMHEGDLKLADQVCRQFLQRHKHHVEGMLLLAEIGIKLKLYTEAEFLLESSMELYPDHRATGIEYLKLLAKMGKFQKAHDCAQTLLAATPNSPTLLVAKASAMVGLGELDGAVETYRHVLQHNERQPNVYLLLGHALKARGDFDDAIAAYQRAYAIKPDLGDAYWSLANTKTYQFTEAERAKLLTLSESAETEIDDKIHMHFALGKAFEDSQLFEQSFTHYAQGNQLKQSQLQYDPRFIEEQVTAQMTAMTAEVFEHHNSAGHPAQDPIFIVGLPRAGSTLLEQILASHSMVDGTMELHNILALVSRLRGQKVAYPALLKSLDPDYLARFGQQYLDETKVYRSGAPLFIDKMPNNFVHIGLIKLILPNAKIIDARRDPMACCFSGFKQLFGEGQEFTYSLTNIGRYYRAYTRLMAHWDNVLPGAVLRVQHEDVIDDLEGQVKRILAYCNLPFEPQCLSFHQTRRVIKTPSSEQVRQPIYRSGLKQWENFSQYLDELTDVLSSG
ncbi:tetratricopeptide repeat-containing sulfotransferase family protein [Alteromonas oceanisediminis]|uniref:tetratricopeptide repeat-containing sulfotransferase family protein n=1 Tax=Alteromonas oceanisediminis TaxID=2836180 RepID=UPI001BDACE74|nr:tetratricopeptide repeat-containing sulfotransferase family protein [Alteromonas oceanisediminis]MBT0586907.1 sulfotransferase [Alteromonas oceanisediminis]